ncbi:MAG TPA: DUF934 domain-containing protein [Xanthobacteraceae bacterium]|jgi:uncharacterized protein (DUF934 family)|nr:DUF934 domain-containing protein [Xanthobacteraceae bacterium]
MRLVKSGHVIDDPYVRVADDAPVPDDRSVIVSAARYLANVAEFAGRTAPTGVLWPNNRRVAEIVPHLSKLALVALEFPKFRDGRAYSQARQLRETHGFRGELRATGDVLRDQFMFMVRAGFDAFEVKKEKDVAAFANEIARKTVFYQPTGDGRLPAARARHLRPAAPGIAGHGRG